MLVELWLYHWRMARTVERMFRLARWDRAMGADYMQAKRSELAFCAGDEWHIDEQMIMRRRSC